MKITHQGHGDFAHAVIETDDGKWLATVKEEFAEAVEAAIAASANRSNPTEEEGK